MSVILFQKLIEIFNSSSYSRIYQIIFNIFYSYVKVEVLYGAW
jgi:hypothetical protein